jgi:hypothetical protein
MPSAGATLRPYRQDAGWNSRETSMQDVVMLLFTVVFFAVAFLYVKACQKLR